MDTNTRGTKNKIKSNIIPIILLILCIGISIGLRIYFFKKSSKYSPGSEKWKKYRIYSVWIPFAIIIGGSGISVALIVRKIKANKKTSTFQSFINVSVILLIIAFIGYKLAQIAYINNVKVSVKDLLVPELEKLSVNVLENHTHYLDPEKSNITLAIYAISSKRKQISDTYIAEDTRNKLITILYKVWKYREKQLSKEEFIKFTDIIDDFYGKEFSSNIYVEEEKEEEKKVKKVIIKPKNKSKFRKEEDDDDDDEKEAEEVDEEYHDEGSEEENDEEFEELIENEFNKTIKKMSQKQEYEEEDADDALIKSYGDDDDDDDDDDD